MIVLVAFGGVVDNMLSLVAVDVDVDVVVVVVVKLEVA